MPKKPRKPCRWPGCPELVDGTYCTRHQKMADRNYEKYKRNPSTKSRYGKKWKEIRDRYISQHPICELCFKNGKTKTAEHVHHRLALSKGGTNDESNLMSLCKSCHSRLHAKEKDHWK